MAGAEMLTNGRGEYRMTPGDWERGGSRTESDPVLLGGFYTGWCFLSLSLSISARGSFLGVKRRLAPSHQRVESVPSH